MSETETETETDTDPDTTTPGLQDLQHEIARLHERVDELEAQLDEPSRTNLPPGLDGRDMAVVETLGCGDRVDVDDLREKYVRHTDVRASSTLADRVRAVTETEYFSEVEWQVWEFEGVGR